MCCLFHVSRQRMFLLFSMLDTLTTTNLIVLIVEEIAPQLVLLLCAHVVISVQGCWVGRSR